MLWDGGGVVRCGGSGTLERKMDNQFGLGRLDQWAEARSKMIINKDSSSPRQEKKTHEHKAQTGYVCTSLERIPQSSSHVNGSDRTKTDTRS
jgi:hypothetical protein